MKGAAAQLWRGEAWLGLLAAVVTVSLLAEVGLSPLTIVALCINLLLNVTLLVSAPGSRMRLVMGYLVVLVAYSGSSLLVEALQVPPRSPALLSIDRFMLGETPAVSLSSFQSAWLGECLTAGYLSYLPYLHWALISAFFATPENRERWTHEVFGAFTLGLLGYLLWPASSPNVAFPELFSAPVAGGVITHFNNELNATASARYDAFPSLHLLITLTLLRHDWRSMRWRFWLMVVPSLVMLVATLALRLHYAADLLASALLFTALCLYWRSLPTIPRSA